MARKRQKTIKRKGRVGNGKKGEGGKEISIGMGWGKGCWRESLRKSEKGKVN